MEAAIYGSWPDSRPPPSRSGTGDACLGGLYSTSSPKVVFFRTLAHAGGEKNVIGEHDWASRGGTFFFQRKKGLFFRCFCPFFTLSWMEKSVKTQCKKGPKRAKNASKTGTFFVEKKCTPLDVQSCSPMTFFRIRHEQGFQKNTTFGDEVEERPST